MNRRLITAIAALSMMACAPPTSGEQQQPHPFQPVVPNNSGAHAPNPSTTRSLVAERSQCGDITRRRRLIERGYEPEVEGIDDRGQWFTLWGGPNDMILTVENQNELCVIARLDRVSAPRG